MARPASAALACGLEAKVCKPNAKFRREHGLDSLSAGKITDFSVTRCTEPAMHARDEAARVDHPDLAQAVGGVDANLAAKVEGKIVCKLDDKEHVRCAQIRDACRAREDAEVGFEERPLVEPQGRSNDDARIVVVASAPSLVQRVLQDLVIHALWRQGDDFLPALAGLNPQNMVDEIKVDLKDAGSKGNWRSR